MFFENAELDPTQHRIEVGCLDTVGEYNTPVRQGDLWPNCTQTGEDGIIIKRFFYEYCSPVWSPTRANSEWKQSVDRSRLQ